jgi:hypothetical protein
MKHTPYYSQPRKADRQVRHLLASFVRLPRLTFVDGPKQLLNSRIDPKTAAIMTGMCAPALLCWAVLTLPAMVFRSPEQNAYYYFSQMINQDPARWVVLLLATVCVVLSMAIPAAMREHRESGSH